MDHDVRAHGRKNRLAQRIASTLEGRASGALRVTGRLTGSAADAWRGLKQAAEGLNLDDTAILAVLLEHGSKAVRAALKDIPR